MGAPTADVSIDDAVVSRVVAEQCPQLAGHRVARLGGGWDNEVYAVGDDLVLRFPRCADRVAWLERELEVLALVGPALPGLVPVVTVRGRPSDAFPYPFIGYPRLRGEVATTPAPRLAREIGWMLTALHGVDASTLRPTPDAWEADDPREELAALVTAAPTIRVLLAGPVLERAAPYLAGEAAPPAPSPARRLIHNDVCAEHLLVDPAGGLSGVLDFCDAVVGDPALDFVGLITVGPHAFAEAAADAYGLAIDEGFWARYVWYARVRTLRWLADAQAGGEPCGRHRAWVARAFEPLDR